MPEVSPFIALRFDASIVGDLSRVVCPPYDVISDSARLALEELSPHNVVRLVLPRGDGDERYEDARDLLNRWRDEGALQLDAKPSLTVYEETYGEGSARRTQRGILAAVSLDDPEHGGVLPHERTYDNIVDDRLRLLRATEANLDCILCVYEGGDTSAAGVVSASVARAPLAEFTTPEDRIAHRVWKIDDETAIRTIAQSLEKPHIVIADGHHRWRTARQYRDDRRARDGAGPWDSQLMLLVDATHLGPSLLPIHRLIPGLDPDAAIEALAQAFDIAAAPRTDPEALAAELAERRAHARCYVALDRTRAWWLTLRDERAAYASLPAERSDAWRALDVSVLHAFAFERLLGGITPTFVHSAHEAAEAVDRGEASMAVLLAPMPFEAVRAVAEAGDAMPQKSTYFVPKPKTGVAFRSLV